MGKSSSVAKYALLVAGPREIISNSIESISFGTEFEILRMIRLRSGALIRESAQFSEAGVGIRAARGRRGSVRSDNCELRRQI